MRKLFIMSLVFSITSLLCAANMHGPKSKEKDLPAGPKISVLLAKSVNSAFLEVKGGYVVVRKDSGEVLSRGTKGKRFVIHALQDGLRWGEEYLDIYQLAVIPTNPNTCMYVNGLQYKGGVSIYHVRDNQIVVVNEVPIEEFLKSTLAIRYDSDNLCTEAMRALVIAERTSAYLLSRAYNSGRPWSVVAEDVGYYGYSVTNRNNGIEGFVDDTRYMILDGAINIEQAKENCLDTNKAEELAKLGFNAKKILYKTFPKCSLGLTIPADEVVLR